MNTPPPAPPRRRSPEETAQVMVPEIEIAKAVEKAKTELRAEWLMNIDRRAIDAAEAAGRAAQDHSARAVKTSHRRWMTILLVLFALGGAIAALGAFAMENRARLERVERQVDGVGEAARP